MSIIFDLFYVCGDVHDQHWDARSKRPVPRHREGFQVDERYRINGGPDNEVPMALDLHAQ